MAKDRNIGGLLCSQILENLSEYVDGNLDQKTIEAVRLHLSDCQWCEEFGGSFAQLVSVVRIQLNTDNGLSDSVSVRLNHALRAALPKVGTSGTKY